MPRWNLAAPIIVLCAGCLLASDLWAHRTSGPYAGYRDQYSETPVVEQRVQSGPYEITLCAFDMGHEVHLIAYARLRENWTYYQDMIKVSILDPDGNAMTIYRDDVTEVIDEPFRWAYRRPGLHTVTVDLLPRTGAAPAAASFTVPLARTSPTPLVLTSAAGVVAVTALAVVVLRRRRQRNGR